MATLILKAPARRVPLLIPARRVWTPWRPWTQLPARPCPCSCLSGNSTRAISTTPQILNAAETDEPTVKVPGKRGPKKKAKPDTPARTPSDTPTGTILETPTGTPSSTPTETPAATDGLPVNAPGKRVAKKKAKPDTLAGRDKLPDKVPREKEQKKKAKPGTPAGTPSDTPDGAPAGMDGLPVTSLVKKVAKKKGKPDTPVGTDELTGEVPREKEKEQKKKAKPDTPSETPSDTPTGTPPDAPDGALEETDGLPGKGPVKIVAKTRAKPGTKLWKKYATSGRDRVKSEKRRPSHPLHLGALRLRDLREIAALCGRSVTAVKPQLRKDLEESIIDVPSTMDTQRILSIDMGVRNLAYCLLEFDPKKGGPAKLVAWERLSLIGEDEGEVSQADITARQKIFSPPRLAAEAVRLVQERLLDLNPTHVLIERQRSRSGGGMAVLEWTIRVNALEAMLHGIFAYHLALSEGEPGQGLTAIEAVSPKKLSVFLLRGGIGDGTSRDRCPEATMKKEKDIKEVKEAIVAKLLHTAADVKRPPDDSPAYKAQDVLLDIDTVVRPTVKAYLMRWARKQKRLQAKEIIEMKSGAAAYVKIVAANQKRRAAHIASKEFKAAVLAGTPSATIATRPTKDPEVVLGKIDDLADCVVQGLVWLEWERNKVFLRDRGAKAILEAKPFFSNSYIGAGAVRAAVEYDS